MRSFAGCSGPVVWTQLRPSKAFLFALIGCSTTPDPWGCDDPSCREDALRAEWLESPGDAVESISQLPDELEKISAVSLLVDHHPGDTGALCELLPHGMSKERCLYVSARASVWADSGVTGAVAGRAGTGPAESKWSAADFETSDMIRVNSGPNACAEEVDPHACAWGWAQSHASAGDADLAAELCSAVRTTSPDPNRWRHFCFLSAAEQHVAHWERARLSDSARLCGAAGSFRAVCSEGLIGRLALRAPPSDVGDERSWMEHLLRANAVRDAWADEPLQSDIIDRFWALSMRSSVAQSQGLSGDALDHLPREAVPHLHAALAWEAVSRSEDGLSYDQLRDRVLEALPLRLKRAPTDFPALALSPVADFWPVDRDGEAHLSAISYLGSSRRTLARDTETDVGLCVLEAVARLRTASSDVLERARGLPDERVKWTAVRLLEQQKGGHPPDHPDQK